MWKKVTDWLDKVEDFCEEYECMFLIGVATFITIITLILALVASVIIEKMKIEAGVK